MSRAVRRIWHRCPFGLAICKLAAAALEQMDERGYDAELRAEGSVEMILKYGIAFSGKMVHVEAAAERL
ncbi:MAG TPA: PD-(D/E)XK nuclease domain-containing protein [Candidatus Lachnoclostridium stercoripullorum]|uniref:PD-(D/E)XK nuclease domain-containing protein n=1 Tax=Candidatus Lachnoclostridium stercoripullorum TaxID=2838635 RepID=A0A9D1W5T8_9FIRM|nr:PD-(D/E)XK nuclease domain-containing protein [Candidatus Lachnoclostridium stercoripullorum]